MRRTAWWELCLIPFELTKDLFSKGLLPLTQATFQEFPAVRLSLPWRWARSHGLTPGAGKSSAMWWSEFFSTRATQHPGYSKWLPDGLEGAPTCCVLKGVGVGAMNFLFKSVLDL